jgi:putative ABC transport system permease protein
MNETFRMALGSLGVNRLRSFLTMSGITIGVFSVIGVMTAVSALRGSIESGLNFLGANIFQFGKYPIGIHVGGNDRHKYDSRRNLTLTEALRYAKLMEANSEIVCLKVFQNQHPVFVSYGNRHTTPGQTLAGSNEHFLVTNQYSIDIGRNLNEADVDLARPVAIIGQDILDKLFPAESPLGKTIKADGCTYTVIGTFARKGTIFGESEDDILIVPITRFLSDFGAQKFSLNIATQAPSQTVYEQVLDKGMTAMRIARGLRPGQPNDFELFSNDSLIGAFAKVADVIGAGAFVISGIALVSAGVGIMNIMLVSVTERTKEIGVRKAIGARKASILNQFLLESTLLSLAGGLAGIVLGTVAGNIVASMLHASMVFPWGWAATGILVCSAIGI